MKKLVTFSLFAALLVVGPAGRASAEPINLITNGDFSSGLGLGQRWESSGSVVVNEETVGVKDSGQLMQCINIAEGGWYTFSFASDPIGLALAVTDDDFGFPDVFAVSLWLGDSTEAFFSIFAARESELGASGSVVRWYDSYFNTLGAVAGWTEVTHTFQADAGAKITAIFSLDGYDMAVGNSYVLLDNVSITAAAVPEPGTLLLLASGLAGIPLLSRRKR